MWLFQNRYPFQWKKFKQLNMGLIRYYSEQSMSNCSNKYTTAWNGTNFFILVGYGVASTIAHARVKLCSLDPLAYPPKKNCPIPSGGVVLRQLDVLCSL